PRCLHLIPKELRSIACEIIPVRPEVVVDDVEKNHQPMHVRRINESLELIGRAIRMIGSKRQHTVVPPVSSAWKIAHRHQLNGRDAELLQLWKLALYAGEPAHRTGVSFIEYGLGPRSAAPPRMAPSIRGRIDDQARPV